MNNLYEETHRSLEKEISEESKRIESLRADLGTRERRLDGLLRASKSLAELIGKPFDADERATAESPKDLGRDSVDDRCPHLPEVVLNILKERGGSMKLHDIIEAVERMGHPLPRDERSRYASIYSVLFRRKDLFEKVGRGEFGVRDGSDDRG